MGSIGQLTVSYLALLRGAQALMCSAVHREKRPATISAAEMPAAAAAALYCRRNQRSRDAGSWSCCAVLPPLQLVAGVS